MSDPQPGAERPHAQVQRHFQPPIQEGAGSASPLLLLAGPFIGPYCRQDNSVKKLPYGTGGPWSKRGVDSRVFATGYLPSQMSSRRLPLKMLVTMIGDSGTPPGSHITVGSEAPWFEIIDGLRQYPNNGCRHSSHPSAAAIRVSDRPLAIRSVDPYARPATRGMSFSIFSSQRQSENSNTLLLVLPTARGH